MLPSATEIVFALGRGRELVGRSAECDYPPQVRQLPVVMQARGAAVDDSSGAIDRTVRSTRARGESLYRLDLDLLGSLRPDLILTQDLCGVCSVTPEEVTAACRSTGLDPTIVALTPRSLEEVWSSVTVIGEAIGATDEAVRLAAELRERTSVAPPKLDPAPRVGVLEWLDPPILAGLWAPEMVALAGGSYLGPSPGQVGERTSWEDVAQQAPDLLVLSPCSFPVERTVAELRVLGTLSRWASAPPALGIWVVDEAYFSRPGPRLANGVELLRALTHRTAVPDGPPVWRWGTAPEEVAA
ncbi:MAG: cobalamin-binding protein [Thermoplasmata archaeon]|nr:cobalamin-binding protein [Thermoplasmata archaeon]